MHTRILNKLLHSWMNKGKVLLLIGARQVGKTTLLRNMTRNSSDLVWLNADEHKVRERLTNPSLNDISNIIGTYKLVIIDEIQRIQNCGLLLKLMVDNFSDVQFIATGSSALETSDTIFEPLTGRQITFHLYPLSLAELYSKKSPFEIEQELPFHLVHGCYPDVCNNRAQASLLLANLAENYLYKDVLIWKNIRKPELLDKLLKLLAYQVGSEVSINELANQLKVKSETVLNYLDILEKSFVIFRMNAFSSNPRKEVTKLSKIFFWDNGIRNAVIGEFGDLANRNDHGLLFENLMISERMKMNSWIRPSIKSYFWRDLNKREVDYVELNSGKICAFEMKWNTLKNHKVSRAFTNLYADADTEVITPENFASFALGD